MWQISWGTGGRTYPEEVLSRVLYATQFTQHLDRHGYVSFKKWRFFSPQLQLWQTSETGWLLALRQPERHKQKTRRSSPGIVQLRFPEIDEDRSLEAL
ncbi:MAG TPA: hypothetical protein VF043_11535 [Ktedonobacteraceae bacterium]